MNVLKRQAFHERGSVLVALSLLLLSCSAVYFSRTQLRSIDNSQAVADRPPLYLPKANYVKLVTLGYNTLASKVLWFNTMNYFGKQFSTTQDYRWLGEMCELVTLLDQRARHTFEFCGTLLSWVAKEPELSTTLLTRGIENDPAHWRYYYLRGFNYWYFQERLDLAKEDFLAATKIPDSPTFLKTIASKLVAENQGPTLARQFLENLYRESKDPIAKKALGRKLKQAQLSERLLVIQTAVDQYRERHDAYPTSLDALVREGVLKAIPPEPFGKAFVIENGVVASTSNQKGLRFKGKTITTSPLARSVK